MRTKVDYGNWISRKMLGTLAAMAMGFLAVPFLGVSGIMGWTCGLLGCLSLLLAGFMIYCYRVMGPLEQRSHILLCDKLPKGFSGTCLDIGAGSGALCIRMAQGYPKAQVHGIDIWKGPWDYSINMCRRNAAIEKVSDRVTFQHGSADAIPYPDDTFDAVVSSMVFHVIRSAKDKQTLFDEALRVLKPGGKFVIQDPFFSSRSFYADMDGLKNGIRAAGASEVTVTPTATLTPIPRLLRPRFLCGGMGIIHGVKSRPA